MSKSRWTVGCVLAAATLTGLWLLSRPGPLRTPVTDTLPPPPGEESVSKIPTPATLPVETDRPRTRERPPRDRAVSDASRAGAGELETQTSGRDPATTDTGASGVPPATAAGAPRKRDPNAFNDSALEALGMDSSEIDRIFEAWANPIPGQASEGLSDSLRAQRFRQLSAAEQGAVRARLGEEDYDALLYAIGQENRLMVTQVPEGTPGALAGVQPGDELLSVDGQRIFNRIELNWLEAGLDDAGRIPITVLRGGELVQLWVENGRMRVGLERIYQSPYRP